MSYVFVKGMRKQLMENRIVFVTEMRDPTKDASSTQIMTRNLISGFRHITNEMILVCVLNQNADPKNVESYYSNYVDKIISTEIITNNNGKLSNVISMLSCCYFANFKNIRQIEGFIDGDTVVVSQSPAIDSALLCKAIVKNQKVKKYIQYWGDPMA